MDENKTYKVTIIVPAYNTVDYIQKCLDSIPIRDDVEVLLIDDCSTDGTEIALQKYCEINPNARVIRNEHNIGVALSKNIAYDNCKGEYVTQLDSDDYYFTDALNNIIDHDLTADLVYFDMQVNNGSIWHSSPITRYTIMDHCCFIKRSLIGDDRCPDLPHGSQVYLNNVIQKRLDETHGTTKYTNTLAYKYTFPRVGSIMYLKNKGLI